MASLFIRRAIVFAILGLGSAVTLPALSAPKTYTVVMEKMKFGPAPSDVHVGDTIIWVNHDMFRHTATARDKSFDVDLAPGAKSRTVVSAAGSYAFYCRFHPGMTGVLVVNP